MRFSLTLVAIMAALAAVPVTGDLCSKGSVEIDGNWYCQAVTSITYTNVGTAGSYNEVVDMASDGVCSSVPHSFSGPIAPFNEEVSLHFRGPIHIAQFAAYSPVKVAVNKRDVSSAYARRHGHQHNAFHKRADDNHMIHGEYQRQEISATINGEVVSWENNWFGPGVTPTAIGFASSTSSVQWVTATIDNEVVSWVNDWFGPSTSAPTLSAQMITATINDQVASCPNDIVPNPAPSTTLETASIPTAIEATSEASPISSSGFPSVINNSTVYQRIGYYNSVNQTLDNLVFLGNYGGQGSGCFDEYFGASLSYVNSAGTGGASSPQVLADVTIPSEHEVTIMTAQECKDGSCGYARPGAVAYHGFDGPDKVFLFEFTMPMDGEEGFEGNMPAIWLLNAKIPRTLQYGEVACSCWESGCGEFDIAEALDDGSTRMKSTLHDNASGGDSDYLIRPTSAAMKLAVVFSSSTSTIHIQVLPDSTDFSSSLTAGEIEELCASDGGRPVSLFAIS
ncbi:Allergen Asp [Hyphodiscus hymeniophilus]|uniref:glucan endo-1,3-beta-D-glucosidase n=1 Tax=Hyphodiscus hymeniophilus TaxID=353542 RepID=A0A9P6VND0_9HELO|nr:Allergen Asp [Hyphodiscus hymeniophilus]